MVSCESPRHVVPATHAVNVLAPTGETITDDTGTAPVLRVVLSARLCAPCASSLAGLTLPGGFVELEELLPEPPDGIDEAKAALEHAMDVIVAQAGLEVLHREEDGFTALIRR